ncbi:hypothetical protein HYALB_00009624 [Hymenoscyphus albidus]|uniref:Uncharacterized protein n=1 Tax=Hymenoscyphus albidus TaxID=595503 RepID=A0A9N9LSL8_9HELO|nr:hypothetical protein HYALB_00009624 [Hymenoscyphus albidus]
MHLVSVEKRGTKSSAIEERQPVILDFDRTFEQIHTSAARMRDHVLQLENHVLDRTELYKNSGRLRTITAVPLANEPADLKDTTGNAQSDQSVQPGAQTAKLLLTARQRYSYDPEIRDSLAFKTVYGPYIVLRQVDESSTDGAISRRYKDDIEERKRQAFDLLHGSFPLLGKAA